MTSIIQQIKPNFDEVLCYSQNLPKVKTDNLLKKWYKAKERIINQWNGKLIIESDTKVTFQLSEEDRKARLNEFISHIDSVYDNQALIDFLEANVDGFFTTHITKDYEDKYRNIKIAKGTKVIKAFKYFESNEKALHDLQTQASMIIQEDKVSGTFCMSVHPLDYLSSSENTYHWRSCHSLDGDYRAGNLSYMLDSSTIICYLKTDNKLHKLPNFPDSVLWNSKKWRMLLFLEDGWDALFAGRQYPFSSLSALELVRKMFIKYFSFSGFYNWSAWMDDSLTEFPRKSSELRSRDYYLTGGRWVALNGRIYAMEDLVTDAKYSQHFNDLKYSSFYTPMYCYNYYPRDDKYKLHFSIGAEVMCLHCDEVHVNMEGSMICLDCGAEIGDGVDEYFTYCGCCQRRTPRERSYWNISIDDYVCEDCYENECKACDHCQDVFYDSEMVYVSELSQYLCPSCHEHYLKNNILPVNDWIRFEY